MAVEKVGLRQLGSPRQVDEAEVGVEPRLDAALASKPEPLGRRVEMAQPSCHSLPRRIGTALPPGSMPSTSTSGPPIMKSVWIMESL
jgi:hypothetical protein